MPERDVVLAPLPAQVDDFAVDLSVEVDEASLVVLDRASEGLDLFDEALEAVQDSGDLGIARVEELLRAGVVGGLLRLRLGGLEGL